MIIMRIKAIAAVLALGLAACGDGEPADQPPPASPAADPGEPVALTVPDWMDVNTGARTVTMTLTAGATTANNSWNFNGHFGGTGGITVPEGYTVTINLVNSDPAMAHSVGVGERQATYPNQFPEVVPVFEGGVTESPRSMTESTLPGETETITFVVDEAGEYALICYVTGHAATGMWLPFTVSEDETIGALP
jgi:FtsP/CotA-like multicopper oxidase with cupredoxin domain